MAEYTMDELRITGMRGEPSGDTWKMPRTKVDSTLTQSGQAADAKVTGDAIAAAESHVGTLSNLTTTAKTSAVAAINELDEDMETKAEIDGAYESMTVGNAEQLVSTVFTDDNEPYNFRTAGGNADIGDRLYEKVVGGTVAWNQLVTDPNFADAGSWGAPYGATLSVSDGVATITITDAEVYDSYIRFLAEGLSTHKYLFMGEYKVDTSYTGNALKFAVSGDTTSVIKILPISANWSKADLIYQSSIDYGRVLIGKIGGRNTFAENDTISFRKFGLFDLTAMFGSTIADYIYSLETANAGDGVAWFKKLFPKDYYAYDAGSLQSVQAAKHVTVGFNQWDEEWEQGYINTSNGQDLPSNNQIRSKNYIPVIPNTVYCSHIGGAAWMAIEAYDEGKNFIQNLGGINNNFTFTTPSNCHYIRFYAPTTYGGTYKNDICINLHWDGERDSEYEAYNKHEYPLADVTLRGIPNLDASNHLYYDGDTYESDGTVTRNFVNKVFVGAAIGEYWFLQSINEHNIANFGFGLSPDKYLTGVSLDTIVRSNWYGDKVQTTPIANTSEEGILFASGDTFYVRISSSKASTVDAFKAYLAEHPLEIVYKLATPTTEEAAPFQSPQVVDDFGTEEYVDAGVTASTPTRDVAIPVGHESKYSANLRAKLEMAPDSPSDGDGDYLVRQTSGENEYVKYVSPVPALPSEDGTYSLKCTVSGSTKTVAWVVDE